MTMHSHFRRIAFVTLFAFFVSTLLPFFAVYNLPQAQAATNKSLFGETVLICTQDGFKLVKWADLETGKEQPKPHKKYQCALCYVSAHGVKSPALALAIMDVTTLRLHSKTYAITDISVASQFSGYRFRSRAPPFIA